MAGTAPPTESRAITGGDLPLPSRGGGDLEGGGSGVLFYQGEADSWSAEVLEGGVLALSSLLLRGGEGRGRERWHKGKTRG
jgi:hypothetical protein